MNQLNNLASCKTDVVSNQPRESTPLSKALCWLTVLTTAFSALSSLQAEESSSSAEITTPSETPRNDNKLQPYQKNIITTFNKFKDSCAEGSVSSSEVKGFLTSLFRKNQEGSHVTQLYQNSPTALLALAMESSTLQNGNYIGNYSPSYRSSKVFKSLKSLHSSLKKQKTSAIKHSYNIDKLKYLTTNPNVKFILSEIGRGENQYRALAFQDLGKILNQFLIIEDSVLISAISSSSKENTVSKNKADLLEVDSIPHIIQSHGPYCTTISVLNLVQGSHSIKLPPEHPYRYVRSIAGLVNNDAEKGRRGAGSEQACNQLGLKIKSIGFSGRYREASKKIKEMIVNDMIPHLDSGNPVIVSVSGGKHGHDVLVSDYNKENDKFLLHDSNNSKPYWSGSVSLAKKMNNAGFAGISLVYANKQEGQTFRAPLNSLELVPNKAALDNCKKLNKIKKLQFLTSDLAPHGMMLNNIAVFWEKSAKVEEKTGITLSCNINNADGRPVYVAFAKKPTDFEFVIVTGYRGGFGEKKGQVQVTYQNGKVEWLNNSDFNKRLSCKFRKSEKNTQAGGYPGYQGVFLAFAENPIRCEVKKLTPLTGASE